MHEHGPGARGSFLHHLKKKIEKGRGEKERNVVIFRKKTRSRTFEKVDGLLGEGRRGNIEGTLIS